jgi:hypothetical protein
MIIIKTDLASDEGLAANQAPNASLAYRVVGGQTIRFHILECSNIVVL